MRLVVMSPTLPRIILGSLVTSRNAHSANHRPRLQPVPGTIIPPLAIRHDISWASRIERAVLEPTARHARDGDCKIRLSTLHTQSGLFVLEEEGVAPAGKAACSVRTDGVSAGGVGSGVSVGVEVIVIVRVRVGLGMAGSVVVTMLHYQLEFE